MAKTVEEVAAEARALRAQGVGGPCPHCGVTQTKKANGDSYASGTHSEAEEAAWSGHVLCCGHCEQPLKRVAGFVFCPTHGHETGDALFNDPRKRVPIGEA